MKIDEIYFEAFEHMKDIFRGHESAQKYPALGYTSNLDILCDFQTNILNQLLASHLPEGDLLNMKPVSLVKTMAEFLSTVVYYCANGIGGEVDIDDFDIIKDSFNTTLGIGGTGMQAAMALAAIKVPSMVHLTDDSQEVCDILNSPYIYTVNDQSGLIHTNQVVQRHEQEIHYIIQFKKGESIQLNNQTIIIPVSNRLIVTKITVNKEVPFSVPFFEYIQEHADSISSIVLSSFNALQDAKLLQKRLDYAKNHIKLYKDNNSNGIVYFEDAHYHSLAIRKLCLETIYPQVDIVSLNEEELAYTLISDGKEIEIDDIDSCINGMNYIKKTYGVKKGIIVHTKDYSMYVGEKLNVNIQRGLICGNMLATSKAMFGWYGTIDRIQKVLKLSLSDKGVENHEKIMKYQQMNKYIDDIIIVPTKYIDKPQYTIGLGDSFVAGVQMCFI